MSLIVEDGTGKPDAESYATVAEADTYLGNRGVTTWASLLSPEKEQALRRATDYMREYEWKGVRTVATQALDWPRSYVYIKRTSDVTLWDKNTVPPDVKNACIELAWRGAGGPLLPDVKPDDGNRYITKQVERVGPVDVETTYASRGGLAGHVRPVWSAVEVMLGEWVRDTTGVYR